MSSTSGSRTPWWVGWLVLAVIIFFPSIAIGITYAAVDALHEIAQAIKDAAPTETTVPP